MYLLKGFVTVDSADSAASKHQTELRQLHQQNFFLDQSTMKLHQSHKKNGASASIYFCQSLMPLVGKSVLRLRLMGIRLSSVLRPSPERRRRSSSAVLPSAAGSSRRPDPVTVIRELMGKVVTAGFHLALSNGHRLDEKSGPRV